jgi:HTH-type transcriptional regulator/antitoxin HigA
VIHTPCLPKTKLHGATRWINGSPIIQLSNQYKRNDFFWFSFFHEAGHIIKHGKKDVFIEGLEYTEIGKRKEAEADSFAMKYTFPEKYEPQLLKGINAASNQIDFINQFALSINTHSALIIGRLAKRNIIHDSVGWKHGFYRSINLANC